MQETTKTMSQNYLLTRKPAETKTLGTEMSVSTARVSTARQPTKRETRNLNELCRVDSQN